MMTTSTIYEEMTHRIIGAIEDGQTPPWRMPRSELENSGFPCDLRSTPFGGIAVLLLNVAATQRHLGSKFWATRPEWEAIGGRVAGRGTDIVATVDPSRPITVFNGDQIAGGDAGQFRSRRRRTPLAVDYSPAEALIEASDATIHHRLGMEAMYYFPPADYIVFPLREQFLTCPGGLPAYYDCLFHELAHFSEPRLGWEGSDDIRELRAELAAPMLASRLDIPTFCEMEKIRNHGKHLARWVQAMRADPTMIFRVAADASDAVDYLFSLPRSPKV